MFNKHRLPIYFPLLPLPPSRQQRKAMPREAIHVSKRKACGFCAVGGGGFFGFAFGASSENVRNLSEIGLTRTNGWDESV